MQQRIGLAAKVGVAAFCLIAAALLGWWGHAIAAEPASQPATEPAAEPAFPCEEDEVYARWEGYPDQPVCVHWEKIEAEVRGEEYTPGYGVRVP